MPKKIIILMVVIVAFSFMAGCGKKTPETTMTHHESGSWDLITTEIYNECMANNYKGIIFDKLEEKSTERKNGYKTQLEKNREAIERFRNEQRGSN